MNPKESLREATDRFLQEHEQKKDTFELLKSRAETIDRLLVSLTCETEEAFRSSASPKNGFRYALMSQGGYGRRELCLYSDIDLLLLYEGKAETFIKLWGEKGLQPLWDAGLEVGFAARTIRDCSRLMETDLTVQTALLDARWIAGDLSLAQEFFEKLNRYFSSTKNRERFIEKKVLESEERRNKFGGSVYLLEPNLKEGEGGLRDYHSILWLAHATQGVKEPTELVSKKQLTEQEFTELWKALCFLWTVRNELHRRSQRKNDQLLFVHQEGVARWMGFKNNAQFLGVELFMEQYYRHAATVRRISESYLRQVQRGEPRLFPPPRPVAEDPDFRIVEDRLTISSPTVFEQDPKRLLKIFEVARDAGLELDDYAQSKIRENSFRIDDTLRGDREMGELFRRLLARPIGLSKALFSMNELQILGTFLPEFGKLVFRVQHDVYHVYTIDVHSLFAVGEAEKLARGDYEKTHPTATAVMKDMVRPEVLTFGILYHDIGKGEGSGHVEKGAPLIRAAAKRLGFRPEEVDLLEFLERSHLIMSHLAFRRDLEDQNLVIQFARSVQSIETLNLLYLLTFCDIQGVSPEAMTEWKASLLEYLYLKTREVLKKGDFTLRRVSLLLPQVALQVAPLLRSEDERRRLDDFFRVMPPRYILATSPELIARHLRLWERFDKEPIVFEWRLLEKEGLNEVTLLTVDAPGLFSKMAGLFTAHHINILEAQLFLSTRGQVLTLFKVGDPEGKAITDVVRWERVSRDLQEVLAGRVPIERLVADKFRPSLFSKKTARVVPVRVEIDNDVSPFYTVIDLYAHDRLGFLYQVTSTLAALGLYVDVSKISTKVDQVADTFYVKDIFGHKITSRERLEKIRVALTRVAEEEPTPGWTPAQVLS